MTCETLPHESHFDFNALYEYNGRVCYVLRGVNARGYRYYRVVERDTRLPLMGETTDVRDLDGLTKVTP